MVKPRIIRYHGKWRVLQGAAVDTDLWRAAHRWCMARNESEAMASFRRK